MSRILIRTRTRQGSDGINKRNNDSNFPQSRNTIRPRKGEIFARDKKKIEKNKKKRDTREEIKVGNRAMTRCEVKEGRHVTGGARVRG